MSAAWSAFADELKRWRDEGRTVDFWWRDDDATVETPPLRRLAGLAGSGSVPLALAVIPSEAKPEIAGLLGGMVTVIQHGGDHRNRAAADAKKNEFPEAEPIAAAEERIAGGRARLAAMFGGRFRPVLAPPWNRMAAAIVPRLAASGIDGLSRFGARASLRAAPGVEQVNTHVDIVDWRGGKGFAGEEAVLGAAVRHLAAKRAGAADATEPTGWLTHHAVHDEAGWRFLERLIEMTRAQPGLRWREVSELFHAG